MPTQLRRLKVKLDRSKELLAMLHTMDRQRVFVGFPADQADRKPEDGEEGEALTNADIGYLMEHGDPEANLPARPFLVSGVTDALPRVEAKLLAVARKVVAGGKVDVSDAMSGVGQLAQAAVRRKITTGPFAPLSERTLARRRARNRRRIKPLIDTGQLRQAVSYVVTSREEVD